MDTVDLLENENEIQDSINWTCLLECIKQSCFNDCSMK